MSTDNTKMCSTNGEVINNDAAKLDDTCYSSLSSMDLNRLQSQFQSAQPLSMRSAFNNSSSLSSAGDNFAQSFSQRYLSDLSNSSLWSPPSKSAQQQTASPFNDLLGHRTISPFNDVPGNHAKTNSVGEIGSGLTNGSINNKNDDNLFGFSQLPKRNITRDIWHHGRNASSNFYASNHNGHTSDILNSVASTTNSTAKPALSSSSGLFDWPLNSADANNPWRETWSQTFDTVNSEPCLETNNKINADSLDFKKLLDSNNSNDKLTGLLNQNSATDASWNTLLSGFEQYITVSICTILFYLH